MIIDADKLEVNQKKWLEVQQSLRITYFWLGEIGDVPAEKILKVLKECNIPGWNTSCFAEGTCLYPDNQYCPNREKR